MKTKLLTYIDLCKMITEKSCKTCEHFYKYTLQNNKSGGYCTLKCKVRLDIDSCKKYLSK
jgi:hypothetical protein